MWSKGLELTIDQVLYEYSYMNLVLYSASLPSYDDKPEDEWNEELDANNPDNFGGFSEEEIFVR